MHHRTFSIILVLLFVGAQGLRFDELPSLSSRPVQDMQLQDYVGTSVRWLEFRAVYNQYPLLHVYAEQLQLVLKTDCAHCVDYYEAAGLLGVLGKTVNQIVKDARDDTHYPVVRRSYVAAVWLMQRSRQFVWETTHMPGIALSTMFRLYLGHVHRAKGRTVSLHHISKCGGTTMCQLAASNRCSNPHLSQEKNCVLNDRLDGPLWMVGHNVSPQGVILNPTIGSLDSEPAAALSTSPSSSLRRRFANEPKMDMWLMYACPYMPNGRIYNCKARAADAHESGTTFLANERTLTREAGMAQVCPDFLNAVILREPVPHAISIMAEVKYRYVRQMATKHNIHSWQPTAWNLTWWEALGPSLVGNYATRTLLGRESLCRSAQNMGKQQLDDALDSLLSFDMVMTLGRSQDIDLGITTLLGWPARNFSSQPGARVREVSVDLATKGELAVGDSKASKGGAAVAVSRHLLQLRDGSSSSSGSRGEESNGHGRSLLAVPQHTNKLHNRGAGQHAAAGKGQPGKGPHGALLLKKGNQQQHPQQKKGNNPQQQQQHPQHGKQQRKPQQHQPAGPHPAGGHPAKHGPVHPQPHPKLPSLAGGAGSGHIQHILVVPAVTHSNASSSALSVSVAAGNASAEHLEQQAAVMLVSTTWHERQAELLNLFEKAAVWAITGEPRIEHTGQRTKHGAHVVKVHFRNKAGRPDTEVWHSFPRHTFAFLAADVAKLERLTHLDLQLYQTADLMFDLDTAWLQAMAASSHYRKKLRALAATETSCGFAGMMPVDAKLLKEPAVEEV